ncbi:MAG TPA: DUF5060 domain-containing protein [Polyangiaceae bacterium]|jgi:hypothetical protein|nr:DUF5060 domain-containing protein [Polyangiaceae bacterium]
MNKPSVFAKSCVVVCFALLLDACSTTDDRPHPQAAAGANANGGSLASGGSPAAGNSGTSAGGTTSTGGAAQAGAGGTAGGAGLPGDGVGQYTVYEIPLAFSEAGLANVWEDVTASAVFTSPSGQSITVGGFYHSTDTWKIRFAPSELGTYSYHATISSGSNDTSVDGSFECVASAEKGFIRSSAQNPLRLVFEDGSLYPALGFGSCVTEDPNTYGWGLDGGDRSLAESEGLVDFDTYLAAMADEAKLNIYRWSVSNCSFDLWQAIATSGNRYRVSEGQWGDLLVTKMREHGVRVYMDFFGYKPQLVDQWQDAASMDAVKRYVDYVVARYGAYVDFWEVCNESSPPAEWISLVANYVKSIDPYQHMVSSSWERPDLAAIDITSPHWYEKEAELASDTRTVTKIDEQRSSNKPIIFGEQGNSVQNWDPLSSLRARIRSWTALFNEGHLIFWESNFAKDYIPAGTAANLYIGPDLRTYFSALQSFAATLPADVTRVTVGVSPLGAVRAYGLKSSQGIYIYARDAQSYTDTKSGVTLSINAEQVATAQFYDTKTGNIVQESSVGPGPTTLALPDFVADIAVAIRY